MLPVVDKPAIQYVVEEAVNAGLHDVLMITGRNKNALENHFDRATELEALLERKGDQARLQEVVRSTNLATMHYVRQRDPLGLGHAVLRAQMHVGDEAFAVLLGDDLIDERDVLLSRMIQIHDLRQASVVALMEVEPSQTHLYGIATVEATELDDVVKVTGLVEKPSPEHAPSNLAVIGRYILQPDVFPILEATEPGSGGEIQLTDALNAMAASEASGGVFGVVFTGRRYDTGGPVGLFEGHRSGCCQQGRFGTRASWLVERLPRKELSDVPSHASPPRPCVAGGSSARCESHGKGAGPESRVVGTMGSNDTPDSPGSHRHQSQYSRFAESRQGRYWITFGDDLGRSAGGPVECLSDRLRVAVFSEPGVLGDGIRSRPRLHHTGRRDGHGLSFFRKGPPPHGGVHSSRKHGLPAGGRKARFSL